MTTTADMMTLQQQTRQDIADSFNISSAMQSLSAGPVEAAKPYRISDLIPRSWDGSHGKSQFRNFTAELHLRMQAWSDQGERILVLNPLIKAHVLEKGQFVF